MTDVWGSSLEMRLRTIFSHPGFLGKSGRESRNEICTALTRGTNCTAVARRFDAHSRPRTLYKACWALKDEMDHGLTSHPRLAAPQACYRSMLSNGPSPLVHEENGASTPTFPRRAN